MLFKGQTTVVCNNGVREIGICEKSWLRKGIYYFNVKMEKGSFFEGISNDKTGMIHVDLDLSLKMNKTNEI